MLSKGVEVRWSVDSLRFHLPGGLSRGAFVMTALASTVR